MTPRLARMLVVLAALPALGCYRMTIVNGRPESNERAPLDGSNHGGFVNGLAEDGQVRLHDMCKGGWSSVHVETGFLNTLANLAYGYIFHAQDVTVKCAAGDAPVPAPVPVPGVTAPPPAQPAPTSQPISL